MSYPPSMVHKSGNKLVVRSVVSGDKLYGTSETEDETIGNGEVTIRREGGDEEQNLDFSIVNTGDQDEDLPQCKVKRNYACSSCSYYTQNPRYYLHHLKNVHKEKIRIYECPHCLYASKHSQKLQRHIHMVHVMGKRKMLIKAKSSPSRKNDVVSPPPCIVPETIIDVVSEDEPKLEITEVIPEPAVEPNQEPSFVDAPVSLETLGEEVTEADPPARETPVKCSLCSFSSRNPNLVIRHERLVHMKKKFYRCTKCDYITHMKARFTKHVKYHSMPMIKCEMCDFRTPYKWNLDRHNKNHFANGAFKCSQCNFTADIKQSLTVHEMNHHVPPVNQNGTGGLTIPTPAKRRCRVGASDIICRQETEAAAAAAAASAASNSVDPDFDDMELLRMERESLVPPSTSSSSAAVSSTAGIADNSSTSAVTSDEVAQMAAVEITMVKPNVSPGCKTLNLKNPTAAAYLNGTLKPEDVILTKNGSVYVKKFKCRVCQYKAAWESEMIRHEVRVHGLEAAPKKKPLPRPIPNLIPIQNNGGSSGSSSRKKSSMSNGSSPTSSKYSDVDQFEKPLTEKDLNDIYAKSCATSSLKDFASLIGAEETMKSEKLKDFMSMFTAENEKDMAKLRRLSDEKPSPEKQSPSVDNGDVSTSEGTKKLPDLFKKKNATFFDRLKEKLMTGAGENGNLVCWCGHKSKCLSESVMHQKTHSETLNDKTEKSVVNGPFISGAELSSTRCQHCRQRCKTSSDLFVHLQSCPEMNKKGSDLSFSSLHQSGSETSSRRSVAEDVTMEDDAELENEHMEHEDEYVEGNEEIKEENKVFVWNNFPDVKEECEEYVDEESRAKSPASETSLVGYEIAPGIGSVIPNNNEDNAEQFKLANLNIDITNPEVTTKKVFKCPKCTFWASTASRFHVHIVSHMNIKPFGCSVCTYQSKWKWDVTKHIKLKKERDPTHEVAEMQTIDVETGRRNYTKYNKYLTVMRVHEPTLEAALKPAPSKTQSPVPTLPKLTPAPTIDIEVTSIPSNRPSAELAMRPLPQLHPANPGVSLKRPHDSGDDSSIPKKKPPSEKKMWKCKKCKFRNTDRNVVLAHVKEHYTNGPQKVNDSNNSTVDSDLFNAFQEARNKIDDQNDDYHGQSKSRNNYKCDICNFETDNPTTLQLHNRHHVENPNAAFKCSFCPFYANDKTFMLKHISSHGVHNAEDTLPLLMNNSISIKEVSDDRNENFNEDSDGFNENNDSSLNATNMSLGGEEQMEIYKRFKCSSCPYVTNNKSQYLYHKQFHRLRGAPFKCNICSYNVTKRHLLHQHLKIHGVKRAQFKNCINDAVEKEQSESGFTLNTDIETANLPDIPLVWVHKSNALTKMFKCRHCPHVNLRKSNIHEHEKMHFDRVQRSPNGSVTGTQTTLHKCTECNYVCNNAGALASHFKVHQGAFGQICAIADPRRSDESQIREITRLLKEDQRFANKEPPPQHKEITSEDLKKRIIAPTCEIPLSSREVSTSENNFTGNGTDQLAIPINPPEEKKVLHFCSTCPARFLYRKDLESHSRFHSMHHAYKCNSCTYSAPQQAQLLAHKRVHSNEYYDKTNIMCTSYETSKQCPRPKTTYILEKPGFPGLGWIVIHTNQNKGEVAGKPKSVTKQYSCHKCPAQFFKSVALQHHLTLHGGKDPYQCRSCDYRVKTYGNLIKHEAVHGLEPRAKAKAVKSKKAAGNMSIPASGTELFQHRSEQIMKEQTTTASPPSATITTTITNASLSVDPEFGILMHGSPEFIYPTTLKNGKMKDKRYKCHKCPSAFEKREQYKVHLPLHGAKYRYKCEKCDYSVKYYANYAQHMRKHEFNERSQTERRVSVVSKASEESGNETASDACTVSSSVIGTDDGKANPVPEKTEFPLMSQKASKTLHISVADQQAVVLMQERVADSVNLADQLARCYYCPYSHQRRDAVENHERCHFNNKGSYVCEFCNYTVPQPHFLREHQKLHFGGMKGIRAEAYMKCDRLEIWMETEQGKVLIFKDNGTSIKEETRFEPVLKIEENDAEYKKMYVNPKTGEEMTPEKEAPELDLPIKQEESDAPKEASFDLPASEKLVASASLSECSSPVHVKDEEMVENEATYLKNEPTEDDQEVIPEDDQDEDDELERADVEEDEDIEDGDALDETIVDEAETSEIGMNMSDLESNESDGEMELEQLDNTSSLSKEDMEDLEDDEFIEDDTEEQHQFEDADEESLREDPGDENETEIPALSGEGSDSEDSDSSSSSCWSSSCSSKSSNGSSNVESNQNSEDEGGKEDEDDVTKGSPPGSGNED